MADEPVKPKEDLLRMQVAKKAYSLYLRNRYKYVRSYNVLKRLEEEKENPLAKQIRLLTERFSGKKKEAR